jgi:hypothetical protein
MATDASSAATSAKTSAASSAATMYQDLSPVLSSLIGNIAGGKAYHNPGTAANRYLSKIPETITPYYQPYIDAGQRSLGTFEDQLNSLVNNPESLLQSLGSTYQSSPGYNWNVKQATNAANQAAAAGGMIGSPQEQLELSNNIMGLANQDYYNYINQALGLYGTGLSGLGSLNTQGFQASNELAQSLANTLQSQSQAAYYGTDSANEQNQGSAGDFASTIAALAPLAMAFI